MKFTVTNIWAKASRRYKGLNERADLELPRGKHKGSWCLILRSLGTTQGCWQETIRSDLPSQRVKQLCVKDGLQGPRGSGMLW